MMRRARSVLFAVPIAMVTCALPAAGAAKGSPVQESTPAGRVAGELEKEAKPIDVRLLRKVSLQVKGIALADVCTQLQEKTGVEFRASRAVGDEKVTIFVKEQPARNVMRAVARLFGYYWDRVGEPGAYRYELNQDLRSQLVEEELRNRDLNAALVVMDAEMEKYRPYLGTSFEQLKEIWQKNKETLDKETQDLLVQAMVLGGWGGIQLYSRLTAADRLALRAGQDLVFRLDAPNPDRRLPADWIQPLLRSYTLDEFPIGNQRVKLADIPGVKLTQVRLRLDRTELGQVSLYSTMSAIWINGLSESSLANNSLLARGRSPSVANPDNATANAALRRRPPFDQIISLCPEPSCPEQKRAQAGGKAPRSDARPPVRQLRPHVFSADVWESVHRETGLPIVADYYTRTYPLDQTTVTKRPLFDALCSVGDTLGVRWSQDSEYLLCRSTSYFWDKLKEVSNRYLQRWAQSRDANGGLPLADLLEMATMPDQQLDANRQTQAIEHCWGLPEWRMVSRLTSRGTDGTGARERARFLSTLGPEQLRRSLGPGGLPFKALTPAQQQGAMQLQYDILDHLERQTGRALSIGPDWFTDAEIYAEYAPAGWYIWTPPWFPPDGNPPVPVAAAAGKTAEEALAAARRFFPAASPNNVRPAPEGHFRAGVRFVGRRHKTIG
jgi:hypothetical protein